jgi:hypothetical protein
LNNQNQLAYTCFKLQLNEGGGTWLHLSNAAPPIPFQIIKIAERKRWNMFNKF